MTVSARVNMTGIDTKPKVISGEPLTLICPGVGIPKPNITWYKDGSVLSEDKEKLTIDVVDIRDAGMYKCVVQNEAGQSEVEFNVKVQGLYFMYRNFKYTCIIWKILHIIVLLN